MSDQATALGDLRVLDCSTRLSGAFCARLFADFGAEVVLIEPPTGHPLRHEPPFLADTAGPERSLLHAYVNANKRAVTLAADDHAAWAGWLAWTDVVITTDLAPWPATLGPLASRRLQLSVTAHGLDGPLAGSPGNDLTAYARSSWALTNGDPDAPPLKGSQHQVGYLAGLTAFVGGLAALLARDRDGVGQLVDVSELEALTLIAGPTLLTAAYAGAVAPRQPADMVRGPVACADGYFALTISRAHFWRDAMTVLGLDDLANDDRYGEAWFRRQQRAHYSARVAERLGGWRRWDLFAALTAVRCVAGVVLDTREVVANPHLAARGFFRDTVLADGRAVPMAGAPFRLSATPWSRRRAAPPLAPLDAAVAAPPAAPVALDPAPTQPADSQPPLAGVRAVVLTQAWAGAFATELLGLLGADVIQIEARSRPDSWRGGYTAPIPPAIQDERHRQRPWNTSGLYNAVNLNKRALTLDLADARGRALFRELLLTADVTVENFSPRVMGNLGLDATALRALRPDLIIASLAAYGADGPYANVPGIGGTIEPMAGMASLLGYEGGRPQNSGAMYPDPVAGLYGAAAILLALRHRARTGAGQTIDLSMMEANATFIGDALLEAAANDRVRPRLGNRHLRIAPHGMYPARDGRWLALAAEDEAAWQALVALVGEPALADQRFATMAGRKQHEDDLDALLGAWTATRDAATTAAALSASGVSAAPVLDTLQTLHEPHLTARCLFVETDHPEAGRHWQPGVPWRLTRTPARVTRPAPMLGEHGAEVLAELLAVTANEYAALVTAGVSGDMPPDGVLAAAGA